MDLLRYEQKFFSQNGEDGIILILIKLLYGINFNDKLDITKSINKFYVEFGVENGKECNTRLLREKLGWKGLQLDGSNENLKINLRKHFITKENIVNIFKTYNVPTNINLLSVDIDYNDFYVLNEILNSYTVDIIICEYNSAHLPSEDKVVIYDSSKWWDGTNYFGASLLALNNLCEKYGYTLVYCDKKGVNCFFVKTILLEQNNINIKNMGNVDLLYMLPKYGNGPNGGHKQDPKNRKFVKSNDIINYNPK